MIASSIAHPNIALVKYWGKTDRRFNIPAVGSISVTLSGLSTHTAVEVRPGLKRDLLFLNGHQAQHDVTHRVRRFLDRVRRMAESDHCCEITTHNNFPTAAGLASSASGYAALAVAASSAYGLNCDRRQLSALARRGSGSAARSIWGGYVELPAGGKGDIELAAVQLEDEHYWPISILIALTSNKIKPVSSRRAMTISEDSSPYYRAWVEESFREVSMLRHAIRKKDFEALGKIAEHSALKLHGLLMAAKPGILYWNPETVKIMREVRQLREDKMPVYFSIDAGPQVKVICPIHLEATVMERLRSILGDQAVISSRPGPPAKLLETE